MIIIKLLMFDTNDTSKTIIEVEDAFGIQKGYSQKDLFALYQKARAKLGITKYSIDTK